MDEKNEKAVKNRFSQARRSYVWGGAWFGAEVASSDQRLLNRIFLRPGRIWL
jgi:hypothetical protein